jgi:hypothetical protein
MEAKKDTDLKDRVYTWLENYRPDASYTQVSSNDLEVYQFLYEAVKEKLERCNDGIN